MQQLRSIIDCGEEISMSFAHSRINVVIIIAFSSCMMIGDERMVRYIHAAKVKDC
jgi:hypothetical protein